MLNHSITSDINNFNRFDTSRTSTFQSDRQNNKISKKSHRNEGKYMNSLQLKKKSPIWHFKIRQRRRKRPRYYANLLITNEKYIKFGAFAGKWDKRVESCRFRGLLHGRYLKRGFSCQCMAATKRKSPLSKYTFGKRNLVDKFNTFCSLTSRKEYSKRETSNQ